jgi:hypothetical protein
MLWSLPPSGVWSLSEPTHFACSGWSLKPETGAQLTPPSSLRNSPFGDVPAYQTSGSAAVDGVSQKTWSTARSRGSPVGKRGGDAASFQVRPPSRLRKTVGPKCHWRLAASNVRPSRGSRTAWWHCVPRKDGSRSENAPRAGPGSATNTPLRVD